MKRLAAAFIVSAGVAVCAGCSADITTNITVTSSTEATYQMAVTFTDEAASALAPGTDGANQLATVIDNRTGHRPTITRTDNTVTAAVDVAADDIDKLSDITGVRTVTVASAGDTTVTITTGPATAVIKAINDAAAKEPESSAVAATMTKRTTSTITVTYPGSVTDHTQDPPLTATNGTNSVTFTRPITGAPAQATVTGTVATSSVDVGPIAPAIAALLLGAVTATWWWRRNKRGPSQEHTPGQ